MKIGYFVPDRIEPNRDNQKTDIRIDFPEKVHFAHKGRYAFLRILHACSVKKVAVPAYLCESVVSVLKSTDIEIALFDIDEQDLNPSADALLLQLDLDPQIEAVLVPSLYGNPADLPRFEKIAKDRDLLLIDDAAQAYGAQIDGKTVGSFGDGGFVSFSPGKPTAWYAGSFFWCRRPIETVHRCRPLRNKIEYFDYCMNREITKWNYCSGRNQ
ncbi:MAG: DegT/DnrJ/EryC1/StrS family aminotransferase [Hyphomicrobiales bacterium]